MLALQLSFAKLALAILEQELSNVIPVVQQLEQQANQDPLLGILRRAGAHQAFDDARETGQSNIGVIVIDLDDFGKINKKWGLITGDRVLATVGQELKKTIRAKDSAVRWGGEEIVIITPDNSPEGIIKLATRLRKAIKAVEVKLQPGVSLQDEWILPADHKAPAHVVLSDGTEYGAGETVPQGLLPVGAVFPEGLSINVTASIGITYAPSAQTPDLLDMVMQADSGVRAVKNGGKDGCRLRTAESLNAPQTQPTRDNPVRRAATPSPMV